MFFLLFIFEEKIKAKYMKIKTVATIIALLSMTSAGAKTYNFLVGTFTNRSASEGIYQVRYNSESRKAEVRVLARQIENPAFLTLAPDSNYVYAVSESGESSSISSYLFDKQKVELKPLNRVPAGGAGPCYIDASEKHVVTANYSGGSLVAFGLKSDGSLTESLQIIRHVGSSIDPKRQTKPYVHQAIFSPDEKYVFTNNLGTDFVHAYRYNRDNKVNILTPVDSIRLKPGSGPRHLTFNGSGNMVYVVQEMDGTLSVLRFENEKLKLIQETTLDAAKKFENAAADIHFSADGKFLYATNRGSAQNITCFKVLKNSKLKFVQQVPTAANWPRNFSVAHDGEMVFIGNQHSNCITVFNRNKRNGKLKFTGISIEVPSPVCLVEF